ncbi:hypothetical protein SpCBS45565_g05674 [Spizellomyces sp. 'palustris']|nr:hypothetical protein SpCBS45565_g05674 [Spizellomyces sp. 'palustris']
MSGRHTERWPHPYAGSQPDPLAHAAEQPASIQDPGQSQPSTSQNSENTESRVDTERIHTLEARLKTLEQRNPGTGPLSALRWTRDQILGIKFSRYILSDRIEVHRVASELAVIDVVAGGEVELHGWCLVRPFERAPPVLSCKNPMRFSAYMQHPIFQEDCETLKAHYKCTSSTLVGQLLYHIPHVGLIVHPALVTSYSRCVGGVFEQCVKQCLDMYVPPDGVLRPWTGNVMTTGDRKEEMASEQLQDTIYNAMNEHLKADFGHEIKKYVAHQVSQCIAERLNRHEQNCNALEQTLQATIEKEIQKAIKSTGTKMARVVKTFEASTRKELLDRYQSIQQAVETLSDRLKDLEESRTMTDLQWLSLVTWRDDIQSRIQAHDNKHTRTLDHLQNTVSPALGTLRTRLDTLATQYGDHTNNDIEKLDQRLDKLEKSVSDDRQLKQEIIERINEMQARVVELVCEKVEQVVLRFVERIVQGERAQGGSGEQASEKASEKARLEKRKKELVEGERAQSGSGEKPSEKARLEKRKKELSEQGRKQLEDGKKRVSPTKKSRWTIL